MFPHVLLIFAYLNIVESISKHPVLIVVSYDAFRYDYFEKKLTPNLERLRKSGTYADYLINVFPTKTFPNHHSIATGLFPENHGVIGNSYFDVKSKKSVGMSYEMFHYSDNVVPIWRWNEDIGDERYSGTMMWPGGHFKYQNKNVTHTKPFEQGYDWYKRIDTVMSWITHPKKPANLVMVYFEEPDTHGHAFGPNSQTVDNLISKLDNITYYLEQQIELHGLTNRINVIHLSDHGMIPVTPPKFINITQYMKNGTYDWAGATPCIQLIPHDGYEDEIYKSLKDASEKNGHFKVMRKGEYLDRWHYKSNDRSPPLLVMADEGYALDDLIVAAPLYAKTYNFTLTNSSEFGVHGYDYNMTEMHPFFMARGPKIKKHHKVNPFQTVDLFELFCEILEIPSMKNNGTKVNIDDIIQITPGKFSTGSILIIAVGGIVLALILIGLSVVFTLMMIKRQQNITSAAALNKRFPQAFQSNIEAQHLLESEEA